jgi:hypothetical protein
MNRNSLQKALKERFNVEELQDLCFTLGIEYQNLSPHLSPLARQIVKSCEQRNIIQALIDACKKERPGFNDWSYIESVSSNPRNFDNIVTHDASTHALTQEQIQAARRSLIRRCITTMLLNGVFMIIWWLMHVGSLWLNEQVSPIENSLFPTAFALGTAIPIMAYVWADTKAMIFQFQAIKQKTKNEPNDSRQE